MEHNTDRILWTVLILAIGIGLYTVFNPAANHLLGQGVEKIQDVATNVNSNKSDSSSSNSGTVDASSNSDFLYSEPNTTDHTISIVGYSGSKENLTIPQYRKIGSVSYKVTSIGNYAFQGRPLTSVDFPIGLTSIGISAFAGTSLTSVDLPAGLTSIGDYAFVGTKLTNVDLPSGLKSIGDGTFVSTKLTSVDLPTSLTSIGSSAFAGTSLTSVAFPDSIKSIGAGAFYNTPISAISFKKRVDLGDGVFKQTNLKNVTLPTGSTYKTNSTFDPSVKVTFN